MLIKGRLRRYLPDAMAAFAALFVVWVSLSPVSLPIDMEWPIGVDKIGHFLCYFVLGFCSIYRRYTFRDSAVTAAAIVSLGGLIEMIQNLFGRTPDVNDFLANCAGVSLAWVAVVSIRRMRQRGLGQVPKTFKGKGTT